MVKPNVSKKDKIIYHFNEDNEPINAQAYGLLSPLKMDNEDLYKIGCMLNNSIRNKVSIDFLISDSVNDDEYCDLLNEWLNKKEFEYVSGSNCENKTKLWEEKIEKLWSPLIKLSYDNFSCKRNKIFSPFGHWVDSCLNKKKREKQNIVPECSCELTEGCYDNGESHSEKGRIRIHYHSV
ncbi:PIR protein [Plasmodium brasilianum]|uniref:PIR protein n=1 Tax=Plasmodium brasilianum TaxID=5824 RepID=A0ACB9YCA8_PLABR|nr:PIR protein [Plasmodium brasilianum]